MPPAPDRLTVQPWMADPATLAVFAALKAAGGADAARFVGGCVRNALIGRPIDDIDICTPLTPERVMAALKAAGLKFAPTGVEHGTVTAIASGRPFEVTTLRRDVETDGRRAVVAFTTDWADDAQRRDFRLNALYADAEGRLYDPTGCGIEDALAGRIVFVGDAETRIREDYLRILRFFRFRAWYGRGPPDAAGLAACSALKAGLAQLSAERVSKELLKLLSAEDPREAVALMADAGVLQAVAPGFADLDRFSRLVQIEHDHGLRADGVLRLAALWSGDPAAIAEQADRLRLSKAQRERLAQAVAREPVLQAGPDFPVRRVIYALGGAATRDRIVLAWAGSGGDGWARLLAEAETYTPPKFPLSGQDAVEAGLQPGRAMGVALREAEAWWVEQDFRPSRDQLMARLRAAR